MELQILSAMLLRWRHLDRVCGLTETVRYGRGLQERQPVGLELRLFCHRTTSRYIYIYVCIFFIPASGQLSARPLETRCTRLRALQGPVVEALASTDWRYWFTGSVFPVSSAPPHVGGRCWEVATSFFAHLDFTD